MWLWRKLFWSAVFPAAEIPVGADRRFCLICRCSDAWPLQRFAFCENTNSSGIVQELKVSLESQNGLGWKGPYRSSSSNPPAMGRDTFHQTRLLKAPANLALNTAREGAATASLGSLCQCLTTLMVKNFFLISNLDLPSFSFEPFPLVLSLHISFKLVILLIVPHL